MLVGSAVVVVRLWTSESPVVAASLHLVSWRLVLLGLVADVAAGAHVVEEVVLADIGRGLVLITAASIRTGLSGATVDLLSLQFEVVSVLHEAHFLEELLRDVPAETLVLEQFGSGVLQLVVGSLNLVDVDLLLLRTELTNVELTSFISENHSCIKACSETGMA